MATHCTVFLPGESQGRGRLVGCHLWGHTESDMTEATQQQQTEAQRGKEEKKIEQNIQEWWDHSKDRTYKLLEYQKEKKQRTEGKL